MSDEYVIKGVEGRWGDDKPSPTKFVIEGDVKVRRLTMYQDDQEVLFMDYAVNDGTRYVLYFEVSKEFRNKKFLEYLKQLRINTLLSEHSEFQFFQPRVVYLRVSPWLAETMPEIRAVADQLNGPDKLFLKQLYIEGAYNTAIE